jgi:GNAT superfamily N-acetyltransferase
VATLRDLRIGEPDRRRGRGAFAALAAEEVARTWGCTRIEASVPATADHALSLAVSLGYGECGRGMEKALGADEPALPEGSTSRRMTAAEYAPWLGHRKEAYAHSWIEQGVPAAEARARSEQDHTRYLPHGRATEDVALTVLEHRGTAVGTLWLALREADAFVLSVEVEEEHRGRGHGRALMLLAERSAAGAGRDHIGLHVFAGNAPALRLYTSLGYRPIVYNLYKQLT